MAEQGFKYIPCMTYDNTRRNIENISFYISRFGKYKMTLRLVKWREEKMTQKEAVEAVEKWLSKEASSDYYDMIGDDLFGHRLDDYRNDDGKVLRGDFLGDCKYLENIVFIDEDTVEIQCGS